MADDSVRVICGPTAAGKSSLALTLAERYDAVIISADSRQIYRGFDIGTAKPSVQERARVPHRGLDVVDPIERYSAAAWAASAARSVEEARAQGRSPLVVGGTGFYLRALFDPLFEAPGMDERRRERLSRELDALPLAELRRWCEQLDPERAALGRTQLLRSIETALLTGERLSSLHLTRARAPRFTARYLVVDPGAGLGSRIERRIREMLASGWASEVRTLLQRVPERAPAWKATGYGVMRRLVAGDMDETSAVEAIHIETRQYAKRQRTWFRHQLDPRLTSRLDPSSLSVESQARAWWEGEDMA